MAEATEEQLDFMQVIEELENGDVRVYELVSAHLGDHKDPLTTIYVKGYKDHKTSLSK